MEWLDLSVIKGFASPPAPGRLAQKDDGSWCAVFPIPDGCPAELRAEIEEYAQRLHNSPHPRLLRTLAITENELKIEWPRATSAGAASRKQGGSIPLSFLATWLPDLAAAADHARSLEMSRTALTPDQWLIRFPGAPDMSPVDIAALPLAEWPAPELLLNPMAGFAGELAGVGAGTMEMTIQGDAPRPLVSKAQWLQGFARAVHQLSGGVASSKFTPIATLGEDRNRLLSFAITGRAEQHTVADWVAAFLDSRSGAIAPVRPAAAPLAKPAPIVAAQPVAAAPLPLPSATPQTSPAKPQAPAPAPVPSVPAPPSGAHTTTPTNPPNRDKLVGIIALIVVVLALGYAISSGRNSRTSTPPAPTQTPAPATPVPATPVPVTPVPATPVPSTPTPTPVPTPTPTPEPTPIPATPVPTTPVPTTPKAGKPRPTSTPKAKSSPKATPRAKSSR